MGPLIDADEENESDNEKLYDAFISYSQDYHDFVMNVLVRALENGSTSFKLCLPYRDWLTSEWTMVNIVKSLQLSQRMIMVLSPSFLENIWRKTEFCVAFSQAFDKKQSDMILIPYGNIEPTDESLDSELKTYIYSNTYIR
ncbi:protein toll-like [Linepithema humile]|uniref:protein toll-like n=1 Tax=Linepithema humile TaxID=83485 RepID=UPI00351E8678